jgi:hypothetical protein
MTPLSFGRIGKGGKESDAQIAISSGSVVRFEWVGG